MEFLRQAPHRLQCDDGRLRVGGDGERERVENEVVLREAVFRALRKDAPRNREAAVTRRWNAVLVEAKSDNRPAVFAHEREDRVHRRPLAVHRVDEWLAVHVAERALKRGGVGGVDLNGTRRDALDVLHGRLDERGLVETRHAAVDVENRRARVRLLDGLAQDVGDVALRVGLLQEFLARRVDALADDDALVRRERHNGRAGGDDCRWRVRSVGDARPYQARRQGDTQTQR